MCWFLEVTWNIISGVRAGSGVQGTWSVFGTMRIPQACKCWWRLMSGNAGSVLVVLTVNDWCCFVMNLNWMHRTRETPCIACIFVKTNECVITIFKDALELHWMHIFYTDRLLSHNLKSLRLMCLQNFLICYLITSKCKNTHVQNGPSLRLLLLLLLFAYYLNKEWNRKCGSLVKWVGCVNPVKDKNMLSVSEKLV